jgi:hypothetical protein
MPLPPFDTMPLWDEHVPQPSPDALSYPAGLSAVVVHRAGGDEFPFLHDTAVVEHRGRLLAAWYNCTEGEIRGKTVIRGRWSDDGGATWGEVRTLIGDPSGQAHYVPVSFLSRGGRLFAFVTRMVGHDRPTSMDCYELKGDSWHGQGRVAGPFLSNCAPLPMADGRLVMGGRVAQQPGELPLVPAVAVDRAAGVAAEWEVIPLPGPWLSGGDHLQFPETTLIVDGREALAFTRNDHGSSLVFQSRDCARTWSGPWSIPLAIEGSKIFAGRLRTGHRYLVYNMPAARRRDLLVIALTGPDGPRFDRIYKLLEGPSTALGCGPEWSYPCAIEHRDALLVSCTSEKRHCVLVSIPLSAICEA